jgi:large subunit ribosomal protein L7/L12
MDAMDGETAARIAALEQHVDRLYALLGQQGPYTSPSWTQPPSTPNVPPPTMSGGSASETVMRYVRQGQEIHAVKQYRLETGSGLRDAKKAVDAIVRDYRDGRIR